jgi:hypothetical protein
MKIKFTHWKDALPQKFHFGRNTSLRDERSWYMWIGKHCFGFEIHGWGPNP